VGRCTNASDWSDFVGYHVDEQWEEGDAGAGVGELAYHGHLIIVQYTPIEHFIQVTEGISEGFKEEFVARQCLSKLVC